MTGTSKLPDDVTVADAYSRNWVDVYAPMRLRPYLRLSRMDRPIGTWLLLIPCWWGLSVAILNNGYAGWLDIWIAVACAIGAFLMRGAGCTWNDITDRNIDGKVERTRSRPIPAGQVTIRQALLWMILQAVVSFLILLTFNTQAILLGIASLLPVVVYPFAKRFTWWPQVFLGLAFNWGALWAYTAHTGRLEWPAITLYLAGIAWTLFYDTIYAHQDREDDALIGVKSTARLFGNHTAVWLRRFMIIATLLFAVSVVLALSGQGGLRLLVALAGVLAFAGHLYWQLGQFDAYNGPLLLRIFRSNRDAGLFPLPFFAAAMVL